MKVIARAFLLWSWRQALPQRRFNISSVSAPSILSVSYISCPRPRSYIILRSFVMLCGQTKAIWALYDDVGLILMNSVGVFGSRSSWVHEAMSSAPFGDGHARDRSHQSSSGHSPRAIENRCSCKLIYLRASIWNAASHIALTALEHLQIAYLEDFLGRSASNNMRSPFKTISMLSVLILRRHQLQLRLRLQLRLQQDRHDHLRSRANLCNIIRLPTAVPNPISERKGSFFITGSERYARMYGWLEQDCTSATRAYLDL